MKKILTVVGARPQFVKAAMLSRGLKQAGCFKEVIVHTGQHHDYAMSEVFFQQLGIPKPDHSLSISGGNHGDMTGRMMCALEPVMIAESPDLVVVYGDTNSTIVGALTAAKLHIAIAHVEAGLRSYNRKMPEEVNRVLTDHLASLLFCPTENSVQNLIREGITDGVRLVGDIMYDAALHFGDKSSGAATNGLLGELRITEYVLATIHRQENTDDPNKLKSIIDALANLSRDIPVLLPMHPRTRARLQSLGFPAADIGKQLHVLDPLGYFEMLALERRAALILTDSGGVQKEAYFFRIPCLTLRDQTEWSELVTTGWNRLIDVLKDDIVGIARATIGKPGDGSASPYGNGDTATKIVTALKSYL